MNFRLMMDRRRIPTFFLPIGAVVAELGVGGLCYYLEIQTAIQQGTLPVSQGYFFAANLDCPDLMNIFRAVMQKPVTNAFLNNLLTEYKKVKPDPNNTKPIPVKKQFKGLASIKATFEKGLGIFVREASCKTPAFSAVAVPYSSSLS